MSWREDNPTLWIDPEPLPFEDAFEWAGWSPALTKDRKQLEEEGAKFYAWVEFYSLERVGVGVAAIQGDPQTGKILAGKELKEIPYFEPLAPLHEFKYALEALAHGDSFVFEEVPYVPIVDREDWERATHLMGVEDDLFEGPGVYDFRDGPPTKSYDSEKEYERASLEEETRSLVEYIFSGGLMRSDLSGEEWKKALIGMMEEAADSL